MQVEAIYDHGRIKLPEHIQLRHQRFTLRLDIPDHEIAPADESRNAHCQPKAEAAPAAAARSSVRARIDAILGPYKAQLCPTHVNTRALWHEHLEEKYLGRR
jgi:hypothetical protein